MFIISDALTALRSYTVRAPVETFAGVDAAPSLEQVKKVLLSAVAACAIVGGSVAGIAALSGADQMLGFKRLLDLNGERNLPTWFASAILLSAAGLLGGIAADRERQHRGGWAFLAGVFGVLSLDEAASLHEMSNAPLRALFQSGPRFYFPWILGGLSLAATVAFVEWPLLRALPRRTAATLVSAGGIYLTGAVGFEALAAPLYASQAHPLVHAAFITTEETLEMAGVALFIIALAQFAASQGIAVTLNFDERARVMRANRVRLSPQRVFNLMLLAALALTGTNMLLQSIHFSTPAHIPGVVRLFDLAREGNIPTWYQSSTLLACGAVAAAIAAAARQAQSPFRVYWALTAVLFVALSADEAASMHEMTVKPLRSAFNTSGLLYYPWIVLGGAAVAVLAVVSRAFLTSLPVRTRRTLLTAAAVFLSGALGVEALGGMYAEVHDRRTLLYGVITSAEETLEMLGIAVAMRALLEYLRDYVGTVRVAIRA